MKLKLFVATWLIVFCLAMLPGLLCAQEFGIGDPDEFPADEDTNVPFDGGISLLVAAGVAYGVKKKYDSNKRSTVQDDDAV